MYDNICKFLAGEFSTDFASWLQGRPVFMTELPAQELSSEPIRADSLILQATRRRLINHLEFQTKPDEDMAFRMADYFIRIYRKFAGYEIWQVVIYLVRTQSSLVYETEFSVPQMQHRFRVIRMWEQPIERFLTRPGLLPLAVLSQCENPETALVQVATEIDRIESPRHRANLAAASGILAGLVLEKDLISQILRRDMMRESVIYQQWREEVYQEAQEEVYQQALEEGINLGREEGWEEGWEEGIKQVARNLLASGMSPVQIVSITGLTLEQIQSLGES